MIVTSHAIDRYLERVRFCSRDEAHQALTSPFIIKAAEFGARFVRLHAGQHVVIDEGKIITVLPREHALASMTMERDWKFKREAVNG